MGLFDFLKQKELATITALKQEVTELSDRLKESISVNADLNNRIASLSRFEHIIDAELEANEILSQASIKAQTIINDAQVQSDELLAKADNIIAKATQQENNARIFYDSTKKQAISEANDILENARNEAKHLRNKAFTILDDATKQAVTIIKNAETRAEEIAGDAYRAKSEAEDLTKTVTALKNTIKGYGDEYLIPTYSVLDQLASDYGYTEAGEELKKARERSRLLMKNDLAAKCDYVEDNRRLTAINFTTDAFNGKVDTILSGVKQDNFGTLKQKITDAYYLVNNLGKAFRNAVITTDYLNARIDELKWAVIVTELRNQEREEQRRIKEQIREEERAKREFEKAIKDAEKDEATIKKALEKAKLDLESASEAQRLKYEEKLAELTVKLKEAEEKGQRALSMAQQTKSGHVYIISNIGSFGENIYKIGMTRRLEPEDRIRELGDASVPFSFDIHAMIYSNDAPALETDLHRYFIDNQLNKVNSRKEFFKVGIADIRNRVDELKLPAKWTMTATASEYRESLAIEKELQSNGVIKAEWEKSQLQHMQDNPIIDEDIE